MKIKVYIPSLVMLSISLSMVSFWTMAYEKSPVSHRRIVKTDEPRNEKEKLAEIIKGGNPAIWVFTGNSITQGAKHTHGMRSYPEIFAERIRWEMGRSSDFIINTAISGNTTQSILNNFDWRVTQFKPQVVSVMIGTNDAAVSNNISTAQFQENLIQLIGKIRGIGAIPIFLTPNTIIPEKAKERSRLVQYVIAAREVVKREDVIFVDNWSVWTKEMQVKYKGKVHHHLLNDPLHPNGLGHKEIAIALFKELSIFNSAEPTCGGEYYEGEH